MFTSFISVIFVFSNSPCSWAVSKHWHYLAHMYPILLLKVEILALKPWEICQQSFPGHCIKCLCFETSLNTYVGNIVSMQAFGFQNQPLWVRFMKIATIIMFCLIIWALCFCKLLNLNACYLFVNVQVSLEEQCHLISFCSCWSWTCTLHILPPSLQNRKKDVTSILYCF